jgi:hypothetical protein
MACAALHGGSLSCLVPSMSRPCFDLLWRHSRTKYVIRDVKASKLSFDWTACFLSHVGFLSPKVRFLPMPIIFHCFIPRTPIILRCHTYYFWMRAARPSKWLAWSLALPESFECGQWSFEKPLLDFSTTYFLRVRVVYPSKYSLGLPHRVFPTSVGCLSLEAFSQSSAPHISFEYELYIPWSILSVFSTAYLLWVWVVYPSKHSLVLQHCIWSPWSAGCLSLEAFSRSLAPHISFECELFIPWSILSVFNTEYCFWVRVVFPSKYLL